MLSPAPTRQPGEDFRRKVAAHWGMSYAQLEALATGEEMPTSSGGASRPPPNFYAAVSSYAWAVDLQPELRRLVTEQAKQYHVVLERDLAVSEWQDILTGLEREALDRTTRTGRKGAPSQLKGH